MVIPEPKLSGAACAECRILLFAGSKPLICAPALEPLYTSPAVLKALFLYPEPSLIPVDFDSRLIDRLSLVILGA